MSVEIPDGVADRAQVAFHEFVFGQGAPLTARDLGVMRQAWKVALRAAKEAGL